MIKKLIFTLLVSIFTISVSFLSYLFCYHIAEKYFFDKFFYYKSTYYGYWVPNKNLSVADFGDRARDLIYIMSSYSPKVLGLQTNNMFQITIIGDSFVWGQGLKSTDRFVELLEKKLNKIRPTKVISLGNCGDNIFDDYSKYLISQNVFGNTNLYIFGLYNNDLVFNNNSRYATDNLIENLSQNCPKSQPSSYDPVLIFNQNNPIFSDFFTAKKKALSVSSKNYCAFENLMQILPKDNTLYIDLGSLIDHDEVQDTFYESVSSKLNALSLNNIKVNKSLFISKNDNHPNSLANKIYADILFQEITTNPKWGFTK